MSFTNFCKVGHPCIRCGTPLIRRKEMVEDPDDGICPRGCSLPPPPPE